MSPLRCTLALTVWSSLAAGVTSQGHAHLQAGDVTFAPDVEPELEVMRAKTGHLLVRPALNGREAGWFIFDTGAAICVISTPLAEPFDLEPAGDVSANGVGGGEAVQTLVAELLELGPMTLHDVPMMRTDLSFLGEHLGVEVAGVIGYGLLSRCIAEVDLQAPRIALHESTTYQLPAGEWTPLAFIDSIPAVPATFEGREGRFQLDIGANAALTLQEPTVRRYDLLEGRTLADAKLGGVGGFVAAKRGRIAWIELAGVRLADVETTFAIEAKGVYAEEGFDGSIGTGLLKEFVLTFDYAGERISFLRRGAAPADVTKKAEK
jgi:hypothetical protein